MGLLCRALDASSGPHLLLRLFALLCAIHRLPISAASALLSTGREDREALRAKEYCEALGLLRCHFFLFRSCLGFRGRGNLSKVRFPFFLIVLCVCPGAWLTLQSALLLAPALLLTFHRLRVCQPALLSGAREDREALFRCAFFLFRSRLRFCGKDGFEGCLCKLDWSVCEPASYIGMEMVNCVTIMWCSGLAKVRCGD